MRHEPGAGIKKQEIKASESAGRKKVPQTEANWRFRQDVGRTFGVRSLRCIGPFPCGSALRWGPARRCRCRSCLIAG